jgi:predicted MFS family arabinose efflux permease
MFRAAPEIIPSVSAVFVWIFQIAVAAGALAGGVIVDSFGLTTTIALGGAIALAAAIVIRGFGRNASGRLGDAITSG